jgi:hypothetical protein
MTEHPNVRARNPNDAKVTRSGRWFRRSRRRHDPMLVLNMSIFNSERGWNRIFDPLPQRENVWC